MSTLRRPMHRMPVILLAAVCVLTGAVANSIARAQEIDSFPGTLVLRGKCIGPMKTVFTVNMTLEANGFGELVGTGRYEMEWTIPNGYAWQNGTKMKVDSFPYKGSLDFQVRGTFAGKTVNIAGPEKLLMASMVSSEKTNVPLPSQMRMFKATLTPDPKTGMDVYKPTAPIQFTIGDSKEIWKMATIIEGKLPRLHPIPVTIQYPIQPAIPRIKNQATFVLPKSAMFPEGKKFKVEARTNTPWTRLWTDKDETKRITLEFDNVQPGQTMTFNYSWTGDLPKRVEKERIYVKVLQPALEGYVDFDVGMAFKIEKVRQRQLVPRVTQKEYELRVSVTDIFHPSIDLAALTDRLGLEPVLTLKQTDYTPGVKLLDVLFQQSPTKFLEYWSQGNYQLKGTGPRPAIITGNDVPFKLRPDGKDFVLQNPGGRVPYPSLQFNVLGAHWFDASIDKLRYSGASYDSTRLKPRKFMWCLYDYGGAEKDVYDVLGPCLETVMDAEDALENPIEYGKQLGECIKALKERREKSRDKK